NCPMSRGLIPIPWSRTLICTVSPSWSTVTRTSPPPGEDLIAFPTRLVNVCPPLARSPQMTGRRITSTPSTTRPRVEDGGRGDRHRHLAAVAADQVGRAATWSVAIGRASGGGGAGGGGRPGAGG